MKIPLLCPPKPHTRFPSSPHKNTVDVSCKSYLVVMWCFNSKATCLWPGFLFHVTLPPWSFWSNKMCYVDLRARNNLTKMSRPIVKPFRSSISRVWLAEIASWNTFFIETSTAVEPLWIWCLRKLYAVDFWLPSRESSIRGIHAMMTFSRFIVINMAVR